MRFKKPVAAIAAAAMILSSLPSFAFAENGAEDECDRHAACEHYKIALAAEGDSDADYDADSGDETCQHTNVGWAIREVDGAYKHIKICYSCGKRVGDAYDAVWSSTGVLRR